MAQGPMRVLLVEDDEDHAELVRTSLLDSGIASTVERVTDGERALRFLRREAEFANQARPELVLLDLKLPRIDGHTVLAEIKGDMGLRDIPVVVLSTSSRAADAARSMALHALGHLIKPLDVSELLALIARLPHP